MVTLGQALAVSLGTPRRPLSTSALRQRFKVDRISLGSLIKQVTVQQCLLFIEVRPISLLADVSTPEELRSKWPSAEADQNTLERIFGIIKPLGVSIVYRSKDNRTIGIRGTNAALLSLNVVPLDKNEGFKDIANAAIAAGAGAGGLAAAGAAEAGGLPAIIGVIGVIGAFAAFLGAGILLGVAILELIEAAKSSPDSPKSDPGNIADSGIIELPADTIIGRVPDGLADEVLRDLFGIDLNDGIPDPGQLPGAGDLAPGSGEGDNGDIPGGFGFG